MVHERLIHPLRQYLMLHTKQWKLDWYTCIGQQNHRDWLVLYHRHHLAHPWHPQKWNHHQFPLWGEGPYQHSNIPALLFRQSAVPLSVPYLTSNSQHLQYLILYLARSRATDHSCWPLLDFFTFFSTANIPCIISQSIALYLDWIFF